jgi:hypothetical protein
MRRTTRARETSKERREEGAAGIITPNPRFSHNVLAQGTSDSLIAQDWIKGKTCRVTLDTGASVTIARHDVAAGKP